jgi:hypothetical protein
LDLSPRREMKKEAACLAEGTEGEGSQCFQDVDESHRSEAGEAGSRDQKSEALRMYAEGLGAPATTAAAASVNDPAELKVWRVSPSSTRQDRIFANRGTETPWSMKLRESAASSKEQTGRRRASRR